MIKRPLSITVIAWLLIFTGLMATINSTRILGDKQAMEILSHNPFLPVWLQLLVGYLGGAVGGISAIGIFKGKHWARLLFAFWVPLGLAIDLTASTPLLTPLIKIVALYAVEMFFLFRPKANQYFRQTIL